LDTRVAARHRQRQLVEQVQTERVSQRGIARSTGISRTTMIKWLKKSH
jgi:DNA invertase Pin-like site-specific DNA recombinase